jgi:mannose-6-phosphate isomerase-like protein (cupin superfamily)
MLGSMLSAHARKDRHMEKVNLAQKFAMFTDHWNPRVIGQINDYEIKIVKVQGEFVWHQHDQTDELFLVLAGRLGLQVREANGDERTIWLEPGELIIIPRGIEHCPVAEIETQLMLLEPKGTVNTGDTPSERTVTEVDHL